MADADFRAPPRARNIDGDPRHIGVEIEYAGLSAKDSAVILCDLFGGEIETKNPHRHRVTGSTMGDFMCELDLQYAHPSPDAENKDAILREMGKMLSEMIGDASAPVVPTEITSPPLTLDMLPRMNELVDALRKAGALGTSEGVSYAFGLHLNPEIADDSSEWITAILRAYLILSGWLRAEIDIDLTRRLFRFADPFPKPYVKLVCDPAYEPGLDRLIDDYLEYNPTRNRELDMLPLFAWIDEDRVRTTIDDPRIKPRPTFHYRLPNAQVSDSLWSLAEDWNRWVVVETLADNPERLSRMAGDFMNYQKPWHGSAWAEKVRDWLDR
tara:strand:+ start:732 stop:1709 length:978 start_codon:yes stop_codon:yes gene_type:complete